MLCGRFTLVRQFFPAEQQPEPDSDRWLCESERDEICRDLEAFVSVCSRENKERNKSGQFWSWTERKNECTYCMYSVCVCHCR